MEYLRATGSALPTDAQTAMKLLGPEIIKSIIRAGGGVNEREDAQKFVDFSMSPEQRKAAFDRLENFQGTALKTYENSWIAAGLPKSQFRDRILGGSEKTKALLDRTSQRDAGLVGAPSRADIEAELKRRGQLK